MNTLRAMVLAVGFGAFGVVPAWATECGETAANLHTKIPEVIVSGQTSQNDATVVELKNPDIDELKLVCAPGDASSPPVLTAKANATWPSSNFYDVLASAGAFIQSSTTSAIRSGLVLCAQRAMKANDNNAVYDVNGFRFECTTTPGVGGSTSIRLSKLKDAPAEPPQPQ